MNAPRGGVLNPGYAINLLMHILEYWTWRSCEGKPVSRGIPQGNEVSSFLGNVYLLSLDEEFKKFFKKNEIKYFRYVTSQQYETAFRGSNPT